jgi:large subunit ribosomal protein L3
MLRSIVATKLGMSQAWTNTGKRMAVTRCRVDGNLVVSEQPSLPADNAEAKQTHIFEIGYGRKKLEKMNKPLKTKLSKSGFSVGVRGLTGMRVEASDEDQAIKVGQTIAAEEVFSVGDEVSVQGTSKGRGFAGGIKRHGFHGGPKTHGQSDRERAVGSIGAGTTPGKVWKGKKMPGHYGVDTKTVSGLVVIHVDPTTKEVWLNGPVPGFTSSFVRITKTGKTRDIEIDKKASGIVEAKVEEVKAEEPKAAEVAETPVVETKSEPKTEEKIEVKEEAAPATDKKESPEN